MGIDPISILAGIATNFATDIIKHYAQHLDKTVVGKGLKAIGLIEKTQEDHLREILADSLKLYQQTHPAYDLSGVANFFRDPVITQQIGSYILDQHPLDRLAIDNALTRHIKKDAVTTTLMARRHALPEYILPDFLTCYRQVLNHSVDAPERAILLTVLDATEKIMTEMRASEERTQTLISETARQQIQILQGNPISLAPDQLIGRYRIQQVLTRGTFGTLYRAEQVGTGTIVALKLIRVPKHLSLHDDVFSLGEDLLKLHHPAIVPTIEVHLTETPPYIVSEYIAGNTLQQRIQQHAPHALPLQEVLNIITPIGQALSYLHQQGIIHRGVQPASILFDQHAKPLLTGFDLAIREREIGGHRLLPQQPGTRDYMAPEQHRGSISKKSDQFALGCIAYELCTGRLPFSEVPLPSTSRQQPKPPPAPHLINPNITSQMEHAILKALSIRQDQRYNDMEAFVAAFTK